jgi:mRNA interferase MazF
MNFYKGDIITCALSGDYGKPRPALIIQSDLFNPTHTSVVICPITSHLLDASLFRLTIYPSSHNRLITISQVMIDKITTIKKEKIAAILGKAEEHFMQQVTAGLKLWFDI